MKRCVLLGALFLLPGCASSRRPGVIDVPVLAPKERLDVLVQRLGSTDPATRSAATWSLAGAAGLGKDAISMLAALLEDSNAEVRYAAAWTLGHVAPDGVQHDQTPQPTRITKPIYPQPAFHAKVEGTVLIEILIGEQGEVAHREIRRSIPGLDEAALACVDQWQFRPATRDGHPAAVVATAPVTFRIY